MAAPTAVVLSLWQTVRSAEARPWWSMNQNEFGVEAQKSVATGAGVVEESLFRSETCLTIIMGPFATSKQQATSKQASKKKKKRC